MGDVKRVERFTCWWCGRVRKPRNLHHWAMASPRARACCRECHDDQEGNYRRVYPGGEAEEEAALLALLDEQLGDA